MKIIFYNNPLDDYLFDGYLSVLPRVGDFVVFEFEKYKVESVTWNFCDGDLDVRVHVEKVSNP